MFLSVDATLIEVNPWAVTPDKDIYCVDAKVSIDEHAAYRQKAIHEEHAKSTSTSAEEDANEAKAVEVGLNYIALDGNIGCMVNGAGLAMATMDIISLKGGSPANFLDVGGGASTKQVATAFEILSQHPSVKAIFVNIFGGIMKCDSIAVGIIEAAKQVAVSVPIIVRLEGTNAKLGQELLREFADGNQSVEMTVVGCMDLAAD